jgi:hypothetical protein
MVWPAGLAEGMGLSVGFETIEGFFVI